MSGEVEQEAVREKLRKHAVRFAVTIRSNPDAWSATATWLRTLPDCLSVATTSDPGHPAFSDGRFIEEHQDLPEGVHEYLYDDEAEYSQRVGPIVRKLMEGWLAAIHRFRDRYTDRYYDFGLEDAQRIALLTALVWNKDFDGAELRLGWRWTQMESEDVYFNCREWAWAKITGDYYAEGALLKHIDVAAEYLDLHRELLGAPNKSPAPPEAKASRKLVQQTGDSRYPDKQWVLLRVAAEEHGIPAGTLHRWIGELAAEDKGETEPRRRIVVRRTALRKLVEKKRPAKGD